VKPGQPTADYIGSVMDKITLPGAILLAVVGILPGVAQSLGLPVLSVVSLVVPAY
jgi:preprotein translocase subunit SecY